MNQVVDDFHYLFLLTCLSTVVLNVLVFGGDYDGPLASRQRWERALPSADPPPPASSLVTRTYARKAYTPLLRGRSAAGTSRWIDTPDPLASPDEGDPPASPEGPGVTAASGPWEEHPMRHRPLGLPGSPRRPRLRPEVQALEERL